MNLRLLVVVFLSVVSLRAQVPSGRWEGAIAFGVLSVPFTIYFDGGGTALTGTFVNGDVRVSSTSGSFEGATMRLWFERFGTRLEATLADGALKGSYGSEKRGLHPFTASAYCTCAIEGAAGPEIMGAWELPDVAWRLAIWRKGEDTLAKLSRGGDELGPLTGRFDGVSFTLRYFDGSQAAVLEIEPHKDQLDLEWKEPGAPVRRYKAIRAKSGQ